MIVEDLDAYLADHGVPCSIGTNNFLGIYDSPDENLSLSGGAGAQSTGYNVLIKTSVVRALAIKFGTAITVNSIAFTARNPAMVDDGAFSNVPLTLVRP